MHEAVAGKTPPTSSSSALNAFSFCYIVSDAATAVASCSVSPIVRIAANEGWMVKRECPYCGKTESLLTFPQVRWTLEVGIFSISRKYKRSKGFVLKP